MSLGLKLKPRLAGGICLCLLLAACQPTENKTKLQAAPAQFQAPPVIAANSVSFHGPRANYSITVSGSNRTIVDQVGSDGSITIGTDIKQLLFTDVSINLEIPAKSLEISDENLKSLVELYIAYFNRVPDANGLSYWIDRLKAGMTLDQIGESFYSAAILFSTQTGYSATMSNADFVTMVYKNVLGRTTPDKEGLDYWSNSLSSGATTRGTLIRTMLGSAHTYKGDLTYGWVAQLLDNKIQVGRDFSVAQGISYISDTDSITKGMAITATITSSDISLAGALINAIVGTPSNTIDLPSNAQASRFLQQSSFGANGNEITSLSHLGYSNWIEAQFAAPRKLHKTYMDAAAAKLSNGLSGLSQNQFLESFWQQAITGEDQLRQRVNFALSQILVISFQDGNVSNYPRGVAGYYDTLATHSFGNFRDLLEAVSLHPMMGIYLTSLRNQKESGTRVPDENYAREVMQLFSIGLYKLNPDGSTILENGKPAETYTSTDIAGLAKVFTGWSWAGPDKTSNRFFGGNPDPDRDWKPMQSYPNYHSVSAKSFLGVTIPAQSPANPEASLKLALDTLFNHPNVGPFIGRQLIQRLVTSNPSPQYIARVSAAFNNNGQGVRGDLKAVIRAILLDSEARNTPVLTSTGIGKLREPVLRLANWLRATQATSTSGLYKITNQDDQLTSIGQTPMRSPTVFNFYRPGYVSPNSELAKALLVAPELQITAETSVVGYLNYLRDALPNGTGSSRDVKANYTDLTALASDAAALVDKVNLLFMANQMSDNLRSQMMSAVNSVAISSTSSSAAATAKLNRVYLSIYLTMASPEYLVQK